jgi:hypothetical protein
MTWKNGGCDGFVSEMWILPQKGIGLVALTNSDSFEIDELARGAEEILVPEPTLSPAVATALEHILASFTNPSPANLSATFTAGFLKEAPQLGQALAKTYQGTGSCKAKRVLISEPDYGKVLLHCEKETLEIQVQVDKEEGHLIKMFMGRINPM